MHINEVDDKSAGHLLAIAATLPDDDYHQNILEAANALCTGYGKPAEGIWEYVTQWDSGTTLWKDRETGQTCTKEPLPAYLKAFRATED